MLLLYFFLSCDCRAFVRVCLYVPCGRLLGGGWPLGSCLWCLAVSLLLSRWCPRSGALRGCVGSWSLHPCLLPCKPNIYVFKPNVYVSWSTSESGMGLAQCRATKCSPTQYAAFSSILCTPHTQYAPLEHFVYPAYTICYQRLPICYHYQVLC